MSFEPTSAPAYLNGAFTTVGECRISPLDRAFLFGDGVYEVIPVYDGKMFEQRAHFERLERSLRETRITSPNTSPEWEAILTRLIDRAGCANLALYLQVSRGVTPRTHAPKTSTAPTVFAMAMPTTPLSPETIKQGVSVITAEDVRWNRCDIKSTSLIANVLFKMNAIAENAHDVILLRNGQVTESSAANVFIVCAGVLATPPKDHWILAGITRDVLIHIASRQRVAVQERVIPVSELVSADEIWLSSSTKEILPVTRIDGKPVGTGVPGPVWSIFRKQLRS